MSLTILNLILLKFYILINYDKIIDFKLCSKNNLGNCDFLCLNWKNYYSLIIVYILGAENCIVYFCRKRKYSNN